MKRIEIIRGGQSSPMVLQNGDRYDSQAKVYDDTGELVHTAQYVNTDFTIGYQGGIIAESRDLAGLVVSNEKRGKHIRIFKRKYIDKVRTPDEWYDYNRLDSLIPNPNHNNEAWIELALYHRGGYRTDGSHACITQHPDHYPAVMDQFENGERVLIDLIRTPGWTAPAAYKGK